MSCQTTVRITNMADVIATRREARRRKILENSQNRLNRITGSDRIDQKTVNNVNSEKKFSVGHEESHFENNESIPNINSDDFGLASNFANIYCNGEIIQPQEKEEITPNQSIITTTTTTKHFDTRIVIFLAIFTNFLMFISEQFLEIDAVTLNSLQLNKIFLPLIVYEVARISVYEEDFQSNNNNNILSSLLLFASIKNPAINAIFVYMQRFGCILQHIILYFVAFMCCDICKTLFCCR